MRVAFAVSEQKGLHVHPQAFELRDVAATIALVFTMGGTAAAATHYLITSTKQIKPSVLKRLKPASPRKSSHGAPGVNAPNDQRHRGTNGQNGTNGTKA